MKHVLTQQFNHHSREVMGIGRSKSQGLCHFLGVFVGAFASCPFAAVLFPPRPKHQMTFCILRAPQRRGVPKGKFFFWRNKTTSQKTKVHWSMIGFRRCGFRWDIWSNVMISANDGQYLHFRYLKFLMKQDFQPFRAKNARVLGTGLWEHIPCESTSHLGCLCFEFCLASHLPQSRFFCERDRWNSNTRINHANHG